MKIKIKGTAEKRYNLGSTCYNHSYTNNISHNYNKRGIWRGRFNRARSASKRTNRAN